MARHADSRFCRALLPLHYDWNGRCGRSVVPQGGSAMARDSDHIDLAPRDHTRHRILYALYSGNLLLQYLPGRYIECTAEDIRYLGTLFSDLGYVQPVHHASRRAARWSG